MKAQVLQFVTWLRCRTGLSARAVCRGLELQWSRYQRWLRRTRQNAGLEDRHAPPERHPDSPLPWEVTAVIEHALAHPKDGYRRLAWQMVDQDVVCLSESAVYRILSERDLLHRWARSGGSGGNAPPPPKAPHERWHTDIMNVRIGDVWYFLVSFLDAYSRYIVHWELLDRMTAEKVTLAQHAALEKYPHARPQIVSDRGCQYTSREYKALIRQFELQHIYCRVAHPQSNGLIERYHRSTREELAEALPNNYLKAQDAIGAWVAHYNEHRLHAGLRYIEPAEYFCGDPEARLQERSSKLRQAREHRRKINRGEAVDQAALPSANELPTVAGAAPTSLVPILAEPAPMDNSMVLAECLP